MAAPGPRGGTVPRMVEPSCRRSQSSAVALANGADSCSNCLPVARPSCSHYLPLCLPTERGARQQRFLLTLAANEQNRLKTQEISAGVACSAVTLRRPSQKPPAGWCFDMRHSRTVLRTIKRPKARFRPRGGLDRQKPWLSRRDQPSCDMQIPLAANVSTILRWRAQPDDGEHSGR